MAPQDKTTARIDSSRLATQDFVSEITTRFNVHQGATSTYKFGPNDQTKVGDQGKLQRKEIRCHKRTTSTKTNAIQQHTGGTNVQQFHDKRESHIPSSSSLTQKVAYARNHCTNCKTKSRKGGVVTNSPWYTTQRTGLEAIDLKSGLVGKDNIAPSLQA